MMQRVRTLLQKLTELSEDSKDINVLDADLMLDYTRVLYADLLEVRKNAKMSLPDTPIPEMQRTPVEDDNKEVEDAPVASALYAQTVPLYDIRTMIGINDKYLFITELFGDDKSAYDNAIKSINNFSNANDVIKWAEEELERKYNWDKESNTVHSFYGLLNSCFPSI